MVFRVLKMPKISEKFAFSLPTGASMLQRGGYSPHSPPLAPSLLAFYKKRVLQWCGMGAWGWSPPSCDLMGVQPPNSVNFLELRSYLNYYSVIKRHFRSKSCGEIAISQDIG